MGELVPIVIPLGFFYFFYKMCELFVTRKERIAIIEKISADLPGEAFSNTYFSNHTKFTKSTALHIGCLLIGIGLGIAIACIIDVSISNSVYEMDYRVKDALNIFYPALSALFGGIGLVISYFLEKKYRAKE